MSSAQKISIQVPSLPRKIQNIQKHKFAGLLSLHCGYLRIHKSLTYAKMFRIRRVCKNIWNIQVKCDIIHNSFHVYLGSTYLMTCTKIYIRINMRCLTIIRHRIFKTLIKLPNHPFIIFWHANPSHQKTHRLNNRSYEDLKIWATNDLLINSNKTRGKEKKRNNQKRSRN